MGWEAVTAMSSLLTALVIAITAIVAVVQIRDLRRATQVQSFLQLMGEATAKMGDWSGYCERTLPERLLDETYRRDLIEGRFDPAQHPELALGAFWEKVGALVHFRLLDSDAFVDFAAGLCPHHWQLLREVAELRRVENPFAWERFEEFAGRCDDYVRARTGGA